MTISRREFFAAGAAGMVASRLRAAPLGLPVGFQVYPVREMLAKDFDGTLRRMATIGYRTMEMCSPKGYERSGFGPLAGMSAGEMRRRIQDVGLSCESSHYHFRELQESLEDRVAFAKELGLKQMIVSTFGIKPDAGMGDWLRAADELNRIGEQTMKAGLQVGFHNHNHEFREIDGALVYDHLMKRLDPKLVKMQFQVAVISIGYDAAEYLTKYPGRFISLHLADWSPAEKKMVAIGKGVVDWKKVFAAARKGGVRNYFVEMNLDLMELSCPYLHKLPR